MEIHEQTIQYYVSHVEEMRSRWLNAAPGFHSIIPGFLTKGSSILDAGCGSGRDAFLLAGEGFAVDACDPVPELFIKEKNIETGNPVTFFTSDYTGLADCGRSYDAVLSSAVLQHIPDEALIASLSGLVSVMKETGFLFLGISLEYPGIDPQTQIDSRGRLFILRPPEQIQFFLERLGLQFLMSRRFNDSIERPGTIWGFYVFRKSSNSGLKPIEVIDSVIRNDRKVNSYKFALIRALADIAMQKPKAGKFNNDGTVAVPLDEIAILWLEYYWPVVEYSITSKLILQGQVIAGKQDFTFRSMLESLIESWSKRGGFPAFKAAMYSGKLSMEDSAQFRDAKKKIILGIKQPIKYAGNNKTSKGIFSCNTREILIPASLWNEFSLMGGWIEDSVILRWAEFTRDLRHQDEHINFSVAAEVLFKSQDVRRDTRDMRNYWLEHMKSAPLPCVWSGKKITSSNQLDIDHILPFSLWRNNDVWNLLPADSAINRKKSDRLPSPGLINKSKDRIFSYWDRSAEAFAGQFIYQVNLFTGNYFGRYDRDAREALFRNLYDSVLLSAGRKGTELWEG